MSKTVLFPGSFDPFTNGHLSAVRSAARLFDQVVVAVATNTSKKPLFSPQEKIKMIQTAMKDISNVQVIEHSNQLTVDLARELNATALLRSLRNSQDLEYESSIAAMNKTQFPELETVFLLADEHYRFISSTLVKEVASFGGDVSSLVPNNVNQAIIQKYLTKKTN